MKKFLTLVFATFFCIAANAGIGEFSRKYDRFDEYDDFKWVGLDRVPLDNGDEVVFGKIFNMKHRKGKQSSFDNTIYIVFKDTQSTDSFSKCSDIRWVVDDVLLKGLDQENREDYESSSFFTFLTDSEFKKFANAKKIEFKVCGKEYAFDKHEMEGIKQVYTEYKKVYP